MESWDLCKRHSRKLGPAARPAWQWSCLPSFGPHTSGEPGQAAFAAFVLRAELAQFVLSVQTVERVLPHVAPLPAIGSMLGHLDQSLDLTRCWSTSSPGSYPMLRANDTSRRQWQRLYLPLDPAISSTRFTSSIYSSMSLQFSQATECRQLSQLMSCKWQSSPHRGNWSHDQNGRRHVRLSNCRKYEMWTRAEGNGSVEMIWSPSILKVSKTHGIFRCASYSWDFFRFEVE